MSRPKQPNQAHYMEVAKMLRLPIGTIRRAFGEPARVEKWFTEEVAMLTHASELWAIIDSNFWSDGSPEQRIILLRILYYTRRAYTRWDVVDFALDRGMKDIVELALEEILRLAKTEDHFREVIKYAPANSKVLHAAIRDYVAAKGRHLSTQRFSLDERMKPKLKVLANTA